MLGWVDTPSLSGGENPFPCCAAANANPKLLGAQARHTFHYTPQKKCAVIFVPATLRTYPCRLSPKGKDPYSALPWRDSHQRRMQISLPSAKKEEMRDLCTGSVRGEGVLQTQNPSSHAEECKKATVGWHRPQLRASCCPSPSSAKGSQRGVQGSTIRGSLPPLSA